MHTTNYIDTFIEVAEDSPIDRAAEPPVRDEPTIAALHYELIASSPYQYTSDDVVFLTHAQRADIPESEREAERERFFSKGQPCLRSSPLAKRYGWGIHHDGEGRVALIAVETDEYRDLAEADDLTHLRAMRNARA